MLREMTTPQNAENSDFTTPGSTFRIVYAYKASNESTRSSSASELDVPDLESSGPLLESHPAAPESDIKSRFNISHRTLLSLISTVVIVVTVLCYFQFEPSWDFLRKGLMIEGGGRVSEEILGINLHAEDHIYRPPTTLAHSFTITAGNRSPDRVKKRVYLVNGLFTGPTIECRTGDKLIINVTNALENDEEVSLHWHGLGMRNSNHMDGAVGFTQYPIPAGHSFVYEFVISDHQSGTFWWHAHSQVQRGDGLYGGLVVHQPVAHRGSQGREEIPEVLLMIGDWYHQSAEDVLAWFTSVAAVGNEASQSRLEPRAQFCLIAEFVLSLCQTRYSSTGKGNSTVRG